MKEPVVKVDLHVHTKYSDSPKVWFLDKVGARECWTEPDHVYERTTGRGMTLVTVTDHDVIEGALALMDKGPHVFISEEVSARFPENGCIAHVLVLNITEAQHRECQRLRYNIYDLVAYLRQEGICHSLAHPLSAVNHRLTADIVEKMFLLFKNMELLNGPRDPYHYHALEAMVGALTREKLEAWANRHQIEPVSWDPQRNWTGGSDDHSGHTIARSYTLYRGDATPGALCKAIDDGQTWVDGEFMTPESLSHTIYAGTLNYYREHGANANTNVYEAIKSSIAEGRVPDLDRAEVGGTLRYLFEELGEVTKTCPLPTRQELIEKGNTEELHSRLYKLGGGLLNGLGRRISKNLIENVRNIRFTEAFHELPRLCELAYLSVPYLIGFRYYYNDRKVAERVVRELALHEVPPDNARVAVFSDTIDSVNGVSLSLRRLADQLGEQGRFVKILGLSGDQRDAIQSETAGDDHIVRFTPLHEFPLVAYEDWNLGVPPVLAIIDWVVRHRINLIQASTPGPMGVAALIVAKLLGIRVVGNYHTQIPEFAERLTGDPTVGRIVRGFVRWFYDALEKVIVATWATRDYLVEMGIRPDRIQVVPRGVDLDEFNPRRRSRDLWQALDVNGSLKLLYVGRVSKEKNIDQLMAAYRTLRDAGHDVELVIVGDGPYRESLQEKTNGTRGVVFTGFLEGEQLAQAYASSDVFVFPSTTDTFGNAVLEAQASGLPAIVTDRGGPSELIEHNRTGYIVPADNTDALVDAITRLASDPGRREQMGLAARKRAEARSYASAADALWGVYAKFYAAPN